MVEVIYPEVEGYTKEIKTGNEDWKTYTGTETIAENATVLARLKDSKGQTGTEKSLEINNIDKLEPENFTFELTATTNSIKVIANAKDQDARDGSAKSGIRGYLFKINDEEWTEVQTSGTYTFENLAQGITYTVRVKAIDNARNETAGTLKRSQWRRFRTRWNRRKWNNYNANNR